MPLDGLVATGVADGACLRGTLNEHHLVDTVVATTPFTWLGGSLTIAGLRLIVMVGFDIIVDICKRKMEIY